MEPLTLGFGCSFAEITGALLSLFRTCPVYSLVLQVRAEDAARPGLRPQHDEGKSVPAAGASGHPSYGAGDSAGVCQESY